MTLVLAQSPTRHEHPESPSLGLFVPASRVVPTEVSTPVCCDVSAPVGAAVCTLVMGPVLAVLVPVPLVKVVACPVPVPVPVPVETLVVASVRVSVWVAVWVREALYVLVTTLVRIEVIDPVDEVEREVRVWVADLVPVALAVLLLVATPVPVEVRGEVTVDVPLMLAQTLTVLQGWLSAQTPELGQALFIESFGRTYASGGRYPPTQLTSPKHAWTGLHSCPSGQVPPLISQLAT
jgi:hypothetical protein